MQTQGFLTVKKEEGHMKMNRILSVLLALALPCALIAAGIVILVRRRRL